MVMPVVVADAFHHKHTESKSNFGVKSDENKVKNRAGKSTRFLSWSWSYKVGEVAVEHHRVLSCCGRFQLSRNASKLGTRVATKLMRISNSFGFGMCSKHQ